MSRLNPAELIQALEYAKLAQVRFPMDQVIQRV